MNHQSGRSRLNLKGPHRRALLRNQVLTLIENGHLVTTKTRAREVKRIAEKLVTIARKGNTFDLRRQVLAQLPYNEGVVGKLFTEIAPRYTHRPGGYTRIIPLGRRASDTATMAKLEWVI